MAETESGNSATPWLAFLVGIIVVVLLGVGYFAFSGAAPPQRTAELTINAPTVETPKINPPELDLPNVNPPAVAPPRAPAPPAPSNSGQ